MSNDKAAASSHGADTPQPEVQHGTQGDTQPEVQAQRAPRGGAGIRRGG